jgi:hypothetical protein
VKPYQKGPGLRPMLLGNTLALALPWLSWLNGHLQPGTFWTFASLAVQVIPAFNFLRLLMRATLRVKSERGQLLAAWLLFFACLGSALWWVPRYAGIVAQ